jgi:UDP-glucuronate 4-epimerase
MNVLVTGAAGFIGYHLVKKLATEGLSVMGLDSINEYYDVNLKYDRISQLGINRADIAYNKIVNSSVYPSLTFVQLNLTDQENLNTIFKSHGFDVVINLAAQAGVRYSITNPLAYIDSNILGFINILECCRTKEIKHLIYASSSSVYGMSDEVPFVETSNTDHPVSLYAATKKSNELMAYTYSHLYKIPVTGLRFFTVYGPWGRPDMSPILFANAIENDQPIKVFNHGNLSRDFTYIDDIVNGIYSIFSAALPAPDENGKPAYEIYNIGNNNPVELKRFIYVMENAMGKGALKDMYPMQKGDVYTTYANIDALNRKVGYQPTTSIEDGVGKFVAWYKSYYKK